MHEIDRTQAETWELGGAETGELDAAGEFGETSEEVLGESFEAGLHGHEAGFHEAAFQETPEIPEVHESPLAEADEMELAAELCEVAGEDELDQFLGRLIRRVGNTVRKAVRSPLGRALGTALKPLARAALPIAARAAGGLVGGPLGGMVGGQLASAAGRLFGLELEGLSAEDRDFEVARRFVRLASAATGSALQAQPTANPQALARATVGRAARTLAPGLGAAGGAAALATGIAPVGSRHRGTWIRRGRRIVLLGV